MTEKPTTKPLWWRLMNAFTNLCLPIVHIVMAFTLAGFGAGLWFVFELCSHFRLLYAAFFLLLLVPCLIVRRWKLVSIVGAFFLVNVMTIVPLSMGRVSIASPKHSLSIMQANINRQNMFFDKFVDAVKRENPDVVYILEMHNAWKKPMDEMLDNYPYRHTQPQDDCFGIGVYSRVPLIDAKTIYYGTSGAPTITCKFGSDNPITLIATHSMPPREARLIDLRNELFGELVKVAEQTKGPLLIAGDLNCTPWSSAFDVFSRDGKLVDSESGFGPQPSWPSGFSPFPVIPIDHFLTTRDVMTRRRYVCKMLEGSDHYPVFIEIAW